MQLYGVKTTGDAMVFPYGEKFRKWRSVKEKKFWAEGLSEDSVPLFGMDKFQGGQNGTVTITEGELDALSAFQMLGSKYACVSIKGAQSAAKDVGRAKEWLLAFDRIVLALDNDAYGQAATAEIAKVLGPQKLYYCSLDLFKDANEYLQHAEMPAFLSAWQRAKKYSPVGVKSNVEELKSLISTTEAEAQAEYPFATLQSITYGIRPGEVVLFTAMEKIGKTEIMRAIEYNLLATTDANIGVIHLEESGKRAVQGLVGYHLDAPVHLPDDGHSLEDQYKALDEIAGDGRLHVYTRFGSDDPEIILQTIRELATICECKMVFLDHISMIVSGLEVEDERKKLDYIATKLAEMTRELNFTLFMVSHVNDDGKTRGSRTIAKVADLLIHLDRDIESPDPVVRNTTRLTCRGNRFSGLTGPAGSLYFDPKTYKLSELTVEKAIELEVAKAPQ